jgi:5-methylcytosine-specific restriction endonuclease McrA
MTGFDCPCLVLNQDYRKVRVINYKDAFKLLFSNKAELLCTYDQVIRTVSQEFYIPAVIRLFKKLKLSFNVRLTRKNIFVRDKFICQYCGKKLPAHQLTLDHVKPRSKGGKLKWENVVASCLNCNVSKSNRTPEEARMPLLSAPSRLDQWQYMENHIGNLGQIKEWSDFV